jgi:hypothetical protein
MGMRKEWMLALSACVVLAGPARAADALDVPPALAQFVPKGHTLIALERADLDGDGRKDYLAVTQEPSSTDPAVEEADEEPGSRRLLVLIANTDGTAYTLAAFSDKVVMCEQCGGVMGDPFIELETGKKTFTVHHYGGSAWRWSYDYTFNYSRIDKAWQLVEAREGNFHATEPDKQEMDIYTPKDFGKVDLRNFDPYTYVKRKE